MLPVAVEFGLTAVSHLEDEFKLVSKLAVMRVDLFRITKTIPNYDPTEDQAATMQKMDAFRASACKKPNSWYNGPKGEIHQFVLNEVSTAHMDDQQPLRVKFAFGLFSPCVCVCVCLDYNIGGHQLVRRTDIKKHRVARHRRNHVCGTRTRTEGYTSNSDFFIR